MLLLLKYPKETDSLPEGAAQFKRMLSLKTDLTAVVKRLQEGAADGFIDKKEWNALSDFMSKVYKQGRRRCESIYQGRGYL